MDHLTFAQLLGNYGEFAGAIGVVVTLIYVAVQMRHNAAATRAATAQGLADSINEINLLLANDAELARIYRVGKFESWDALTEDEKFRWSYVATAGCRSFEAVFTNNRLQQADKQTVSMVKQLLKTHFKSPAWRTWWAEVSKTQPFTKEFTEFVKDECLSDAPTNN